MGPDFEGVRKEVSGLFDRLVPTMAAENVPYTPLDLGGSSPIISVEDAGFRSILAAANPGQYDLAYRVMVRVNRSGHGAATANDMFDDVRREIISIVTDYRLSFVHFEALEIPNGQGGETFFEVEDGQQYLTGFIPVVALNVICRESE
jgi:hypothetical protein